MVIQIRPSVTKTGPVGRAGPPREAPRTDKRRPATGQW